MDQTFLSNDDFSKNYPPQTKCSVCGSNELRPFMHVGAKYYWTCNVCKARILSCQHWLSKEEEFKYYQTHQNISSDPAYQKFAAQLALPILGLNSNLPTIGDGFSSITIVRCFI